MKSKKTQKQIDQKFNAPPSTIDEIYGQRYTSPLQGILADAEQKAIISIINKRRGKAETCDKTPFAENQTDIEGILEALIKTIEDENNQAEKEILTDTHSY